MSKSKLSLSKCISLGIVSLCALSVNVHAASYSALQSSMQARQPSLEKEQIAADSCLGERIDGLLKINNCSSEIKALAEDENKDRTSLYTLMSVSLGKDPQLVGFEWAKKRNPRYIKGIVREVRLEDGSTTFWNGIGEHPDEKNVARVLTKQYAKLYESPNKSAKVVRDNLPLYEAFGVVKQENKDGTLWYQVTEAYVPKEKPQNWSPKTIGWISEADVIPWKRALVMRFTNSLNRDPSIFFKTPEDVLALMKAKKNYRNEELDKIYTEAKSGKVDSSTGALAIEPTVGKDQEQVVMYPLLDFYKPKSGDLYMDGQFTRLLEVAAQTRNGTSQFSHGKVPMDIVFVMDLTSSMKPYVEQLITVMKQFATDLNGKDVRFGIVGYQDKSKQFSFTVKDFTSNGVVNAADFVNLLNGIKTQQKSVKGDDIPEAVFNGLNGALESKQWREQSAKAIILIGDAPGREDDFTLKALRDKAHTRHIPIYSLFIDESKGSARHARKGKKQYKQLSSTYEGAYGTSRQIPHLSVINGGITNGFSKSVITALNQSKEMFDDLQNKDIDSINPEKGSFGELFFQQAKLLLADPSMPKDGIVGWTPDKVMNAPGREALAPMILLNETELDELEQRVRELKNIGEMAMRGDNGTTLDFFDLVSANTRFTMVDPAAVNFRDAFSAPLGINSLPYDSDIMATTREEFQSMDRVQSFVRAMNNKLTHYEDLKREQGNPDVWKKLSTGTSENDRVVALELNQLP
ncbi:vWA domain-containing protein [Photobacterium toruni]|uniref:vWA domain-containing protein n=1 Tax=Photobacterium toruni TaxID=1935446 RepID=UPI002E16C002|nr:vWA domain-containing protein [Photobacterium toruni]